MSADNGIYILKTTDNEKETYRVAHAQAIDNFGWYEQNEPEKFADYIKQVWGKSPTFFSIEKAYMYARELAQKYFYIEYGIQEIVRPDINFLKL